MEKYLQKEEILCISFGISRSFFALQVLGIISAFGFISYFYQGLPIISIALGIIGGILLIHVFAIFMTTDYFASDRRIYRRTAYLWQKLISADKEDITDIRIQQNILERIIGIGTIKINTSGSTGFEIVFTRVWKPFAKRKALLEICKA